VARGGDRRAPLRSRRCGRSRSRPYQKERILTVVDPDRDPLASGFQSAQSRIAIGSGGLFGTGYREGTQTQLRFLPAQHTDFAFSVLAEEWGFVGSCAALALYATLFMWGLVVGAQLEGRVRSAARDRRRRVSVLASGAQRGDGGRTRAR
jgi:cell division protein FtsW (lipid II flippase)